VIHKKRKRQPTCELSPKQCGFQPRISRSYSTAHSSVWLFYFTRSDKKKSMPNLAARVRKRTVRVLRKRPAATFWNTPVREMHSNRFVAFASTAASDWRWRMTRSSRQRIGEPSRIVGPVHPGIGLRKETSFVMESERTVVKQKGKNFFPLRLECSVWIITV